jgi:uncharacterized Tic20 family protein
MPVSSTDPEQDTRLAVVAQTLYLTNLLLLPGIAFVTLLSLYLSQRKTCSPFSLLHLRQTLSASLWAGFLLVVCNLLIVFTGGYDGPWTWVIVIVYFTMAHSTLILLGMVGLIKAMAGQTWRYPLIGSLFE